MGGRGAWGGGLGLAVVRDAAFAGLGMAAIKQWWLEGSAGHTT